MIARQKALFLGCCLLCLSLATQTFAEDSAALRRFALLTSANDGGVARPRLKHALADARAVGNVLRELGGVLAEDSIQLEEPSPDRLRQVLLELRERIASARQSGLRIELLFYYSGHSDERGLLLRGSTLRYAELRSLLDAVAADVRIAILDSCASGAFTREKGGVRRAPFLFDSGTFVRGHAFLSSASESEAAQESDGIGGSFFTHYLVSGLRGAADTSGDRKVTLTEAYRFAFDETLARTGQTQGGAQHPAYDMRLAGTGDLVLTDLRSTAAQLELAEDVAGQLLVRPARGGVFLELHKHAGKRMRIALPAGGYVLELHTDSAFFTASVSTSASAEPRRIARAEFVRAEPESTRSRGDDTYLLRPVAVAFLPRYGTNAMARGRKVKNRFNLALLLDAPEALQGFQLGVFGAAAVDVAQGLQLAGLFTHAGALRGAQLSALANHVDTEAAGLALSAALNLGGELFTGLQLAAINWTSALRGVQLGAFNLARSAQGVQLGALNVATGRVRGVQLGVFNYADDADVALGVLSITKHGGVHAVLGTGDTSLLSFALRLDARYNYNFVAVGVHPLGGDEHRGYSVGLGMGAKLPLFEPRLWLDIDLGWHVLQASGTWARGVPNMLCQLRGLLRLEIFKYLSVFAGPTFNLIIQLDPLERVRPGFGIASHEVTPQGADKRVAYWPGFAAGLRF